MKEICFSKFLSGDKGGIYGREYSDTCKSLDIEVINRPILVNGYSEKLIGTIKHECASHITQFCNKHLRRQNTIDSISSILAIRPPLLTDNCSLTSPPLPRRTGRRHTRPLSHRSARKRPEYHFRFRPRRPAQLLPALRLKASSGNPRHSWF